MYYPIENEIFHVHTYRCKHAGDYTDSEYIEKALSLGATRIVFTDHCPFPGNPFRNRMTCEQLPEYIQTINDLKSEYSGRIEVLCGLEVEYLPSFNGYIEELHAIDDIEIMVIGQHFFEHKDKTLSFNDLDKSEEFKGLFEAMIQGVESGLFDVVAHPDRAFRRRKSFCEMEKECSTELVDALKKSKNQIKLEQNYSSILRKNQYKPEFWESVPRNMIIYGYDAHSPEEIEKGWLFRKERGL